MDYTHYHECPHCGHEIECLVDVPENLVDIPETCPECGGVIGNHDRIYDAALEAAQGAWTDRAQSLLDD